MTDINNQWGPIAALALITIVLSIYTLVSMRWWLANGDKLPKRLIGAASLIAIACIIVAPLFLLIYLMGKMKLAQNFYPYGAATVLLTWIAPGVIYNLIYTFRRKN
jgi:hypothetical protein